MGILDEAIREHLELKRQHGAADPELRKLEDEAFGPSARPGELEPAAGVPEPEGPAMPPAETSEPLPEAAEPVHERDEPATEAPVGEEHPAMEHRTVDPASTERSTELYEYGEGMAPEEGAPPDERALEDEFFSEQSLSDELDHALEAPGTEPAPRSPEIDESLPPPDEKSVGEEPGAAREDLEDEGDDVLEETPDFLQDTPEHDRLWFEQRPPKDFDFDD